MRLWRQGRRTPGWWAAASVGITLFFLDLAGQLADPVVDASLLGDPVILELEEEAVRSEEARQPSGPLAGRRVVLLHEEGRHLSLQAGAQPDQPGGVLGQRLMVDPRLVVEPLQVADRG